MELVFFIIVLLFHADHLHFIFHSNTFFPNIHPKYDQFYCIYNLIQHSKKEPSQRNKPKEHSNYKGNETKKLLNEHNKLVASFNSFFHYLCVCSMCFFLCVL